MTSPDIVPARRPSSVSWLLPKATAAATTAYDPALPPHAQPSAAVLAHHAVAPQHGLSTGEAARRLDRYGRNAVAAAPPVGNLAILVAQVTNPVVWLLGAAIVLSLALGDVPEAVAIALVLVVNTVVGFVAEQRAVRSMEALRRLDVATARVRRSGATVVMPAHDVVPGDIVLLEAGEQVPADMRTVTASRLAADESALTGESVAVEKGARPVAADAKLHERASMLFKGTAVTSGSAVAVVTATGGATELGRIATLAVAADAGRSPLEERLAGLTRQLIGLTLAIALGVGLVGLSAGEPLLLMLEASVALAIAAVPEGLPIVATLTLARGMLRMARENALVRSLGAVETLGATTVILTDKTGTLTENRMSVARLVGPDGEFTAATEAGRRALTLGVLCSNADRDPVSRAASGDPLEVAFLDAATDAGLDVAALRAAAPRLVEHAFDPATRMMATVHHSGRSVVTAVKGAPEAVLAASTRVLTAAGPEPLDGERRDALRGAMADLAGDGLRLIAVAEAAGEGHTAQPFADLTLVAIAALRDPPRADIPAAIAACHRAGIHVVMVTGDHEATARAIARSVGLADGGETVRARVTPEEKLTLVRDFQAAGAVVAMTGDGVNDAPALRQADIGIAMGIRGTDVAREAADIVLLDDAFATVVTAVREGRVIFGNIRRFCAYLLSCNLGEILAIALALVAGLPLPLTPLQILFLNLVTDVSPAFALAAGRGDSGVLDAPPRPAGEPILGRRQWTDIAVLGAALGVSSVVAYAVALYGLGLPQAAAGTVALLALGCGQIVNVLNMRRAGSGLVVNDVTGNPWVGAAAALSLALFAAALAIPAARDALAMVPPTGAGWGVIAAASLAPLAVGQILRTVTRG